MRIASNYYVYVYIDPRNFEEFYYGKGHGARKYAHLSDKSDSEKVRRINAIRKAGLEPIIRVIARDLSGEDALLVEKTLLWKLGRQLTNISSGHYADNFRPHFTLHTELTGFDFQCGLYYYNVGEGPHRNWDDYKQYGFISAGGGAKYRDAMLNFRVGDIVATYLKGRGFVGIGRVTSLATPAREATIVDAPLLSLDLRCKGMAEHAASTEMCEYVAGVEWLRAVERTEAKMKRKSGIFTTTHIRANLDGQPTTVAFLEEAFQINLREHLDPIDVCEESYK
jgi:uncharacterized protein